MKVVTIIRNLFLLLLLAVNLPIISHAQLLKKLKDKVNQTIDRKTDKAIDKTVNGADNTVDNTVNRTVGKDGKTTSPNETDSKATAASGPTIASYKNYDFVPGDKIIFEDHFDTDEEGEFPSHWHLSQGQGTVNTFDNRRVFLLTDYQTKAIPAIKTKAYLTDAFTVEFDTYSRD
ncbi:MAG: hypothetical protein ACXVB6_12570, partial [Mucilaginibacter sp.]